MRNPTHLASSFRLQVAGCRRSPMPTHPSNTNVHIDTQPGKPRRTGHLMLISGRHEHTTQSAQDHRLHESLPMRVADRQRDGAYHDDA